MSLLNRMSLIACCVLLCSCSRAPRGVKSEPFLLYKRFLSMATAFDYCGCSYSENDAKIAAHGYSDEDALRYYLAEHGHERESITFFSLVTDMERNAKRNGQDMAWDMVDKVKGALMRQKGLVRSRSGRFSAFCYERNLMRLLYSVARVVEVTRCSPKFSSAFVTRTLPNELFEVDLSGCDWVIVRNDWLSGARAFRDLLLVSCHVGVSGENNDWCLSGLKDESLRSFARSGNFRLLGDHEGWIMVFGDKRRSNLSHISTCSFHCPQIEGQKLVFLSSDYSRRRARIFREGEEVNGKVMTVRRGRIAVGKKK